MTFFFLIFTTVHNIETFTHLLEGTEAYALFHSINDIHVKNGEMEHYISCCHLCFPLTMNACRIRDGCLPSIASLTLAFNMPPGISVSVLSRKPRLC